MTIAIEFDGVIVEDKYPHIGEERAFAFDTLRRLDKKGHSIILWSRRYGKQLEEAVEFCRQHNVEFYAVNKSYPEEVLEEGARKINADLYIDNRMVEHLPDWGAIYQMVKHKTYDKPFDPDTSVQKKKTFFNALFNI